MSTLPNCPKCQSQYTYEDASRYVYPECGHEWGRDEPASETEAKK